VKRIEGHGSAAGKRFGVVAAKWHNDVTERLIAGACEALIRHGALDGDLTIVRVPGSYELPLACRELAVSKRFDAVIALGCLIKGETDHYQLVAEEVTRGLSGVVKDTRVPVTFGVIVADSIEKAEARAGGSAGNKGEEAAEAAIEMANVIAELRAQIGE